MGQDNLGQKQHEPLSSPLLRVSPSAPPQQQLPPAYNQGTLFADVPEELVEDVRGVQAELTKLGITSAHEARVCLVLDISRSMQNPNQFFHNTQTNMPGPIYALLNKALSAAMVIDDNKELEVFPFGSSASEYPLKATKYNFKTVIDADILRNDPVTTMQPNTNYAAAMRAVRKHYFGTDAINNPVSSDVTPVFMLFVTDGNHNVEQRQALAQFRASSYQPIFCKIIALKGKTNPDFQFLQKDVDDAPTLDERKGKPPEQCHYIDNADFVCINDPSDLTMNDLFREYPQWLLQAQEARHGHTLLSASQGLDQSIVNRQQAAAGRVGEKSSCCTLL